MPSPRTLSLLLVVGALLGCSTTSSPPMSRPSASTSEASTADRASEPPDLGAPPPSDLSLPPHATLAGPNVSGAFDAATDGVVIAWSSGTVDVDAPELWTFDPASSERTLAYRSGQRGAILANLAVRHGSLVFAEVLPRADGTRTWRLVLLDPAGTTHVLDMNDVPPEQVGVLPMAAISDRGVLWATSHAGDGSALRCELRYAALDDLQVRTLEAAPCNRTEIWYPRSDGRSFVYGTVEYRRDGATDERHVYLITDSDLDHPVALDRDGAASLPAVLDGTVIWKAAPHDLNMFSPGDLVARSLSPGAVPQPVRFPSLTPLQLTTPTIGPAFYAAEDAAGASVRVWDRARSRAVEVDGLPPADPGFFSGTRLAGALLIWFYTSSSQGGGTREIRWLKLRGS